MRAGALLQILDSGIPQSKNVLISEIGGISLSKKVIHFLQFFLPRTGLLQFQCEGRLLGSLIQILLH